MKKGTRVCKHLNHTNACYGDNIYNKVNNQTRIDLVNLVKKQGMSLKEAAEELNVNYSTAKTIIRIFRIEKRILKKQPCRRKLRRVRLNTISTNNTIPQQSINIPNHETQLIKDNSNDLLFKDLKEVGQSVMDQFKEIAFLMQDCLSDLVSNEILLNDLDCFLVKMHSPLQTQNN